jgi:hypothetical protein
MANKDRTSPAQRLYNRNLSQSAEDISPDMARGSGKVMKRTDFSDEKTGPNFRQPQRASRVDNSDGSKVGPNMGQVNKSTSAKPKAKVAIVALPKSTTPDMDTSKGTTGSRSDFSAGEVSPFAKRAEAAAEPSAPEKGGLRVKASEDDTPLRESSTQAGEDPMDQARRSMGFKKGGSTKCMSSGGSTASRRGDGIAARGKTKGRIC